MLGLTRAALYFFIRYVKSLFFKKVFKNKFEFELHLSYFFILKLD